MALAPPPARFDVPDNVLLKRLARGDPGVLERIRARYALTLYAIAYGVLMDARRAAAVVDETIEECARVAGESFTAGVSLFERLATTARQLSRDFPLLVEEESPGTGVPAPARVLRERWLAPRSR